ncbi:MAG: hypothetical protein MRY83_02120 [Flavobacteriales bacterium]|nr:hypothetical protein [Flavobacteriales bacterium]
MNETFENKSIYKEPEGYLKNLGQSLNSITESDDSKEIKIFGSNTWMKMAASLFFLVASAIFISQFLSKNYNIDSLTVAELEMLEDSDFELSEDEIIEYVLLEDMYFDISEDLTDYEENLIEEFDEDELLEEL